MDVTDRWRWRWLLTDADAGTPLAGHQVELTPGEPELAALTDLHRYLRWQADPDRRVDSEAELLERVGGWLGTRVLGEAVGAAIVAAAPVTVRVQVPDRLGFLLFAPLELAHVGGEALARRGDVSLVFDVGGGPARHPV